MGYAPAAPPPGMAYMAAPWGQPPGGMLAPQQQQQQMMAAAAAASAAAAAAGFAPPVPLQMPMRQGSGSSG